MNHLQNTFIFHRLGYTYQKIVPFLYKKFQLWVFLLYIFKHNFLYTLVWFDENLAFRFQIFFLLIALEILKNTFKHLDTLIFCLLMHGNCKVRTRISYFCFEFLIESKWSMFLKMGPHLFTNHLINELLLNEN